MNAVIGVLAGEMKWNSVLVSLIFVSNPLNQASVNFKKNSWNLIND